MGDWEQKDDSKFFNIAKLKKWAVLSTSKKSQPEDIRLFIDGLTECGKNCGLDLPPCQWFSAKDITAVKSFFESVQNKIELVVVIIDDVKSKRQERKVITYGDIKNCAEISVGILTQCIKVTTISRNIDKITYHNILLKLNAKLNGINHDIQNWPMVFRRKPVIIVGANLFPSSSGHLVPDIASVAASHDELGLKYNIAWKLQWQPKRDDKKKNRKRIVYRIECLKEMMYKMLRSFMNKNNGMKPESILFYRDGLYPHDYIQVSSFEKNAIIDACHDIDSDYNPSIVYFMVTRRHRTRIFPQNPVYEEYANVLPGTLVDSVITHPSHIDFYLVSHFSRQGTVRPTRYLVLSNDSYFTQSQLEVITFYLCSIYTRCNRIVSYPAPNFYAILAIYRVKAYLSATVLDEDMKISLENKLKIAVTDKNPMYFV